jgi:broad specificity phosphatase PhoE
VTARLDLIAHGASGATRAARFPQDEPLETSAIAATTALRGRLRRYDRVLTSSARAALGTAEALGLEAEFEPALEDCYYARWRGLTVADLAAQDADGLAQWLSDPDATPHGGESLTALIGRVDVFLSDMLTSEGATLAITHASIVRAAIVTTLSAGPMAFWRIDVAPLSIARLSGREGRWNLVALGPYGTPS